VHDTRTGQNTQHSLLAPSPIPLQSLGWLRRRQRRRTPLP
jgi:hypothetical protein